VEITPQWDGTTWHWVILDEVTLHPNQWIEQSFEITPQWDGTTWHWVILDEVTLHPNQWIKQKIRGLSEYG